MVNLKPAALLLLGFLATAAQASAGKIIYHLHSSDPESYRIAITNLENLQKGMSDRPQQIKLLLQGDSIQMLNLRKHNKKLNKRLVTLLNNGVSVEVSRANYQQNQQMLDLSHPPHQVESIFSRIIELQKQGYQYITP